MTLTKSQKKYLKKNIKRLPPKKIAANLDISEKEILKYLKSHWREKKYEKFLAKQKHLKKNTSERGPTQRGLLPARNATHSVAGGRGEMSLKAWFSKNKLALLFLAFLVFAVYFNSLGNDFVSDDIGIVNSTNINKISYFWKPPHFILKLRPLIIFLTHKVFGLQPIFYRLSNIFFHLGSTWVAFLLIGFFFQSPIPLITASIFAVHPILTESVAWISGGGYVYSTFFAFLSFLTYIHTSNSKGRKGFKFWLLSVFLFYLALSCSGKLIVLPLVFFLYELSFGKLKTNWPRLIPFWAISGFWGLRLFGLVGTRITSLETVHYQEPRLYNPLIQIPIAITSYLELIFWPKSLTLYHSEMSFSQIEYWSRLGAFVLFLIAIAYFFKKDRRIFFWLSFFIISLLPFLTPLRISWIVAERYVYLGSLGIFILIAWIIQKIGEIVSIRSLAKEKPFGFRIFNPKGCRASPKALPAARGIGEAGKLASKISYALLAIILILLSARTIIRNRDWKNQDTLWLATAKTSPSSPQNHNNLGDYYGRQGNLERAVEEFKKAIELNPNYGDAYHNLANTYQQMGKIENAIENYQKAIEFGPHLWQSHQNLAAIYFEQEKYDLALQEIERAINIHSQNPSLYNNLGLIYLKLGEKEKAQKTLNQALQLDPENQQAKKLLNLQVAP